MPPTSSVPVSRAYLSLRSILLTRRRAILLRSPASLRRISCQQNNLQRVMYQLTKGRLPELWPRRPLLKSLKRQRSKFFGPKSYTPFSVHCLAVKKLFHLRCTLKLDQEGTGVSRMRDEYLFPGSRQRDIKKIPLLFDK